MVFCAKKNGIYLRKDTARPGVVEPELAAVIHTRAENSPVFGQDKYKVLAACHHAHWGVVEGRARNEYRTHNVVRAWRR